MNVLLNNISIFFVLLHRDLKGLIKTIRTRFIDNLFILSVDILLFGWLLPLMGMPQDRIAPFFVSSIMLQMSILNMSIAKTRNYDLRFDRFINYQLTLPISKKWLFAEKIVFAVIEASTIIVPAFFIGFLALRHRFIIVHTNWFALIAIYIFSLFVLALLYNYFAFAYSYQWFSNNLFIRRLGPMNTFSSGYVPWKVIAPVYPLLGWIALFSPVTYMGEGIRSAMIGSDAFLSLPFCFSMLFVFCLITMVLFTHVVKKRLDPV